MSIVNKCNTVYINHDAYNIYQLKIGFWTFKNYSYIIVDNATKEAAIIDPAWDFNVIKNVIDDLDIKLTKILLTHSHFDHVNMVGKLVKYFSPQVFMSEREIQFYKFTCKNLNSFRDLDSIMVGQTNVTCIVTPGHTYGGACYFLRDHLFTGDTIFIEGCGICTDKGGSPSDMFDSFQKIKNIVHPKAKIYPGHSYGKRPGYTLQYLYSHNIYFCFEEKEEFIQFRMRPNQSKLFDFK